MELYRVVLGADAKGFVGAGTITTKPTHVQVSLGPNVESNINVQDPDRPFTPAALEKPYTYAHANTKNEVDVLVDGKKTHSYPSGTLVELRKANIGPVRLAMFLANPKLLPATNTMMGMGRRSRQSRRSKQNRRSRQSRKSRQNRSRSRKN